MLLVANFANANLRKKDNKMAETLAYAYSSESTHWELKVDHPSKLATSLSWPPL